MTDQGRTFEWGDVTFHVPVGANYLIASWIDEHGDVYTRTFSDLRIDQAMTRIADIRAGRS